MASTSSALALASILVPRASSADSTSAFVASPSTSTLSALRSNADSTSDLVA